MLFVTLMSTTRSRMQKKDHSETPGVQAMFSSFQGFRDSKTKKRAPLARVQNRMSKYLPRADISCHAKG